jgi:hypothetical protein
MFPVELGGNGAAKPMFADTRTMVMKTWGGVILHAELVGRIRRNTENTCLFWLIRPPYESFRTCDDELAVTARSELNRTRTVCPGKPIRPSFHS